MEAAIGGGFGWVPLVGFSWSGQFRAQRLGTSPSLLFSATGAGFRLQMVLAGLDFFVLVFGCVVWFGDGEGLIFWVVGGGSGFCRWVWWWLWVGWFRWLENGYGWPAAGWVWVWVWRLVAAGMVVVCSLDPDLLRSLLP